MTLYTWHEPTKYGGGPSTSSGRFVSGFLQNVQNEQLRGGARSALARRLARGVSNASNPVVLSELARYPNLERGITPDAMRHAEFVLGLWGDRASHGLSAHEEGRTFAEAVTLRQGRDRARLLNALRIGGTLAERTIASYARTATTGFDMVRLADDLYSLSIPSKQSHVLIAWASRL